MFTRRFLQSQATHFDVNSCQSGEEVLIYRWHGETGSLDFTGEIGSVAPTKPAAPLWCDSPIVQR